MSITDDVPVDTRITPTLHPGVVEKIEGFDESTKAVLGPTQTAFSAAYEGVRSVWKARALLEIDTSKTEDARLVQLDTFASKNLEKISQRFDKTMHDLNRGIDYIEGELSVALTEQAAASFGKEIRDHVKGLTTTQRQEFIRQHINAGDVQVVAGVLGAPPFLSGMDANMQQVLTRLWNEKQNPDKAKRLHVMKQAKAMIERDAGKVFKEMELAVGGQSDKAGKVRAAQVAADKALSA